jgi:hypothetical protein
MLPDSANPAFRSKCYFRQEHGSIASDPNDQQELEATKLRDIQVCTKMSTSSGFLNVPDSGER